MFKCNSHTVFDLKDLFNEEDQLLVDGPVKGFGAHSYVDASSVNEALIQVKRNDILTVRKTLYKAESDPLFMESKFDSTAESHQKWQDKVAEIKARYPLPENA